MKFQDSSPHGSKVTVGIKKCDVHTYTHTHTQAKSNIPHQGGIIIFLHVILVRGCCRNDRQIDTM